MRQALGCLLPLTPVGWRFQVDGEVTQGGEADDNNFYFASRYPNIELPNGESAFLGLIFVWPQVLRSVAHVACQGAPWGYAGATGVEHSVELHEKRAAKPRAPGGMSRTTRSFVLKPRYMWRMRERSSALGNASVPAAARARTRALLCAPLHAL